MSFSDDKALRNYLVITGSYWGFTLTDGALRMLVVLYFHQLGYAPLDIALLFLFYEFFGIVTNLLGGWIGARIGLNLTMHLGIGLQIIALAMLTVDPSWLSVGYVMAAQARSGIAKDLNKMSAKSSVKLMVVDKEGSLFRMVALLTGSKNALKGVGFFLGGLLLSLFGFQNALWMMAAMLGVLLLLSYLMLPKGLGKAKRKPKFTHILSKSRDINILSAARLFLFGARDVWFVVGLPVFFSSVLGWSHTAVGTFLALWVIGYGFVQSVAPKLIRRTHHGHGPDGGSATLWVAILTLSPAAIALALHFGLDAASSLVIGLGVFGILFAINSAIHSYLILNYSKHEEVAGNVGFYYMANAAGRLSGTVLSGWSYQQHGLEGCLLWSALFLLLSAVISRGLPRGKAAEISIT
jgi:predicted MFS family arabinose efflux permease